MCKNITDMIKYVFCQDPYYSWSSLNSIFSSDGRQNLMLKWGKGDRLDWKTEWPTQILVGDFVQFVPVTVYTHINKSHT